MSLFVFCPFTVCAIVWLSRERVHDSGKGAFKAPAAAAAASLESNADVAGLYYTFARRLYIQTRVVWAAAAAVQLRKKTFATRATEKKESDFFLFVKSKKKKL